MKNEKVFSAGGFYQTVHSSNALLHREAARIGARIVAQWLGIRAVTERVRVLDLACGSFPYAISEIISQNSGHEFEYWGIDINPDQIAGAKAVFAAAENIASVKLTEGDVWDVHLRGFDRKFDIIYSGLNLHHGTIAQLKKLFSELNCMIDDKGIFLSHDFYRPQEDDVDSVYNTVDDDWRPIFIEKQASYLRKYGAEERGILENAAHIMRYDHPLPVQYMADLLDDAGFSVRAHDLNDKDHPLGKYFAFIEARIKVPS